MESFPRSQKQEDELLRATNMMQLMLADRAGVEYMEWIAQYGLLFRQLLNRDPQHSLVRISKIQTVH